MDSRDEPAAGIEPQDDRHAWAEPGVEDLGGGLYRIPLPLPGDALTAVNVYAITGERRGGPDRRGHGARAGAGAADRGARPARLRPAATSGTSSSPTSTRTTTRWRSSCGPRCAARSRWARASAPTWTRSGTSPPGGPRSGSSRCCPRWARPSWPRRCAASWRRGSPTRSRKLEWSDPDRWLARRRACSTCRAGRCARSTPRATPRGHVVFHDEAAAMLFAGDHVLPHITPSIGFQPVITRLALSQYLGSLRLMLTLPDARLLPAHGPVQHVHPRAGAPAARAPRDPARADAGGRERRPGHAPSQAAGALPVDPQAAQARPTSTR